MKYLTIVLSLFITVALQTQTHSDHQQLTLDVSQYDEIHIYNKHGQVKVNGTSGSQATIDIDRKLKAKSKKKLQASISNIYIDTIVMDDVLVVYVNSPYYYLDGDFNDRFMHYQTHKDYNWGNSWKKIGVEFIFELDIEIPSSKDLVVTTHTGELEVRGISGKLAAKNHHNDVLLDQVSQVYYAHSHHGDVTVNLDRLPSSDIELDTHHGDIKLAVPSEPSAEVSFDSHHGSFYTDFNWTSKAPKVLKSSSRRSKKKTKYKLGDGTVVQMGSGEHRMTFDTHHGDMYLIQL